MRSPPSTTCGESTWGRVDSLSAHSADLPPPDRQRRTRHRARSPKMILRHRLRVHFLAVHADMHMAELCRGTVAHIGAGRGCGTLPYEGRGNSEVDRHGQDVLYHRGEGPGTEGRVLTQLADHPGQNQGDDGSNRSGSEQ